MYSNAVAFFSDRASLPGLHATLVSLQLSNPDLQADVYVFADGLTQRDKKKLRKTWQNLSSSPSFHVEDFKLDFVGDSLHGNQTAWGRVFLGELLHGHAKCLYLDCDLLVNANVNAIFDLITDDIPLIADCSGQRRWVFETPIFEKAGIDMDLPCFNSGVMGINLVRWRELDVLRNCRQVASLYKGQLKSPDQTVLNLVFHDSTKSFGDRYNTPLYPSTVAPVLLESRIYHLVGSPKPWDLMGRWLNRSYSLWKVFYKMSAIGWAPTFFYFNPMRELRIARQSLIALKSRISALRGRIA